MFQHPGSTLLNLINDENLIKLDDDLKKGVITDDKNQNRWAKIVSKINLAKRSYDSSINVESSTFFEIIELLYAQLATKKIKNECSKCLNLLYYNLQDMIRYMQFYVNNFYLIDSQPRILSPDNILEFSKSYVRSPAYIFKISNLYQIFGYYVVVMSKNKTELKDIITKLESYA